MLRVLFVDDDPSLLARLRQRLQGLQSEWVMSFARSGEEALDRLRQDPHDIVVSDGNLPGVDDRPASAGGESAWPTVVRVVLSGQSDEESTLRSIGSGSVDGAFDAACLRAAVQRTFALQRLFTNDRVRVLVARMDTLPSAPTQFHDLTAELLKDECSLLRVGEIISEDMAMTAKILRIVNSAYFGLRSTISDPALAARFLGGRTLTSLVLGCHLFKQADPTLTANLGLEEVWDHSLLTSRYARRIAESESNDIEMLDDSLAAGMLHDAGRVLLAINFPEMYRGLLEQTRSGGERLIDLERASFGVTHAEVGAYLMGIWGLGETIVEAIAYHHAPSDCVHREFSPLTAVHAACAILKENNTADLPSRGGLDLDYLASINLSDRPDIWREMDLREAA
jgi:HD-like signal output (HDOD) protein